MSHELNNLSKIQLINKCKRLNITGYSNKKKEDLIRLIKNNYIETDEKETNNYNDDKKSEINNKKSLGQYFTINNDLQQFVFDNVKYKNSKLLEPSFGAGHLLIKFLEYNLNYDMECYEIDNTIKPIVNFNEHQNINYCDFTKKNISYKFKTIIGNPPYIKKTDCNLYIKFIDICYDLLDDNGELIFIIPSDFIKLTSASNLINKMITNGSFTNFLFPNNEKLFNNANIDIMIFRYEKNLISNNTTVNNINKIYNTHNNIITFSDTPIIGTLLNTLFNVYVGMVSGKDEVYKVDFGNTNILCDKNKLEKFIYIEKFPCEDEKINEYLINNKGNLLNRRIKKFNDNNWFLWGAPRNIKNINKNLGKKCIYVKNMTRSNEVAFIDTVKLFGGSLICLIPKNEIEDDLLKKIVKYLNSEKFKSNYLYSGRFKIGHRQITNIIIPN
jgi:adenine-specific DNA-methyltransferase